MEVGEETALGDLGENFLAFPLPANSSGPAVKSLDSFLCSSNFGWSLFPSFSFYF